MTDARKFAEKRLMRENFPAFVLMLASSEFGFSGKVHGPRTGTMYKVELRVDYDKYPSTEPDIYIKPRISQHWLTGGRLCVSKPWNPATSTFANLVLTVITFLVEHDGML